LHLAQQHEVSRKYVYQQAHLAEKVLRRAFDPPADEERVLFYLPVTKTWLRQLVLALVVICHSSYRGVIELLRDFFDYSLSLCTVHNIVYSCWRTGTLTTSARSSTPATRPSTAARRGWNWT
jgi:hypothetical protein